MSIDYKDVDSVAPDGTLERLLGQAQALAGKSGASLYNVRFRNAGVALEWHEPARQGAASDFRAGLHVYGYHPDLKSAVVAEVVRLLNALEPADPMRAVLKDFRRRLENNP